MDQAAELTANVSSCDKDIVDESKKSSTIDKEASHSKEKTIGEVCQSKVDTTIIKDVTDSRKSPISGVVDSEKSKTNEGSIDSKESSPSDNVNSEEKSEDVSNLKESITIEDITDNEDNPSVLDVINLEADTKIKEASGKAKESTTTEEITNLEEGPTVDKAIDAGGSKTIDEVPNLKESSTAEEKDSTASHQEKNVETNLEDTKTSEDESEDSKVGTNTENSENENSKVSEKLSNPVAESISSTERPGVSPEQQTVQNPAEESDKTADKEASSSKDEKSKDSTSPSPTTRTQDVNTINLDADSAITAEISSEKASPSKKTEDVSVVNRPSKESDDIEVIAEIPKAVDNDKQDTSAMEVDADVQDKEETTDKNVVEPEKTEFIQISQDKQDDSQIEGQSMDAEDPFGGDSLPADTVEPLDTDDLEEQNINFCKLGDQADNLQDVLKSKDSACESPITVQNETESISEAAKEGSDDISNDSIENKTPDDPQATTDQASETNASETSKAAEKPADDDKSKKKDDDDNIVVRATDEQSTVLPGQDDELCIIPDNMKIILPQRSTTKGQDTASPDTSKDKSEASQTTESTSEPVEKSVDTADIREEEETTEDSDKREDADKSMDQAVETAQEITDNVIDVEEESKNAEIEEVTAVETCKQCKKEKSCKIKVKLGAESFNVCSKECQSTFLVENNRATDIPSDGANSKYEKRCVNCLLLIETTEERNLSWETMEFCNEECLGKFQTKYGSYCRNCNGSVAPISLGKYCVRFGYDVRQFCCSTCLEEFKKGLKVCSYCQKDISSGTDGFLAPVGDKGQFKDFCTQFCMEKYSKINSTEPPSAEKKACSVCQEEKIVHCEVQVDRAAPVAICSEPCFAAFKFVNKVDPDQCSTCKKYFDQVNKKSTVVFYNNEAHTFCNKTCLNIFIITHRKIVPCNWCKVKKYNFDMIKKDLKNGQAIMMCSLNCLTLYQVSMNAVSARRINCDFCKEFSQAQYHLTMSDATVRNFCSYDCVMKFQGQYTKSPITIPAGDDSAPVPTGIPKRAYPGKFQTQPITKKPVEIQNLPALTTRSNLPTIQTKKTLPVISSVTSLASNGQSISITAKPTSTMTVAVNNASIPNAGVPNSQSQLIYKQQVIMRPPSPMKIHNKMTQCKPLMHTKGVSVKPHPCTKSTQTDEEEPPQKILIPIPVPIYVPFPVHMWSFPFPVPMPFPLPIPVPIFIPTTRNSAKGIFKEIKRIQEKVPSDPFEAELLMMAEMVATEKKTTESDSDSDGENNPEPVDSSNSFGDDMLQMALKMATGEIEEPAVDLEAALTPNTITASQPPAPPEGAGDAEAQPERAVAARGKKRVVSYKSRGGPVKRGRRTSTNTNEVPPLMPPPESQPPSSQPRIIEPAEKPDANMALKYTFGVNAWRKWVVAKNAELEKQSTATRKVKLFKTDLLQLTADELNYTLCLFVKEVRKPNGAEYAPDTIYYLCLGIQQYLFENNRIDNIFTDTYYEQFTDCLNDVAKKFSVLYNDAQYIVTRVEEEHLWECKQLGAHSPHVLLSTLMFFNTKHFNLVTVEEHMQLSFSHIMKHWKRNPAAQAAAVAGKAPGSRNVLLRFYPPQSALEANSKKKKVYEQQENEENPLRCPVKLYEFYLSKCPESVKTRNDVFYLLPERSCVPDSPVWYSTSALAKEHLVKMLHRVKMVKEINVALLST